MGNTRSVRVASWLVLVAACGGDDDPFRPPGGSDAPPRIDAAPDAAFDAPMIDARIDGPLGDSPPVITLTTPADGTIVAGTVRIEVKVEDPDGVTDVRATVGSQTIVFTRIAAGMPNFQGFMNTAPLAGLVSPQIVVRAEDTVGTASTLTFQVILDNVAPLASLDPPNVRVTKPLTMAMADACSHDFDPLGPDAPDDGEAVPQLFELRARIADLGNTGTLNSTLYIPNAGVATANVYVFDDTTKPLVVDTNGDGFCDAINPTIVPTTTPMLANEAAVSSLTPITPQGAANFMVGDPYGGSNAAPTCQADPNAMMAPGELCLGEPGASMVIKTPFTGLTQVYGMPVVSSFNCLGFAFDARATGITDGWACAAVLTTDGVGNTSVSAPLRICIDYDGVGNECHALGTSSLVGAPDCTGTVTAGAVTATACTPRGFFRSSTADEYELVRP